MPESSRISCKLPLFVIPLNWISFDNGFKLDISAVTCATSHQSRLQVYESTYLCMIHIRLKSSITACNKSNWKKVDKSSIVRYAISSKCYTTNFLHFLKNEDSLFPGLIFLISSFHFRPKYDSLKPALQLRQENEPQKLEHASTHPNQEVNKVQCDICSMWLENRYLLFIHRKIHMHFPQKCQHCDKVKFNMPSLRSHIRFSHAPPTHKCHVCGKSFIRPKTLKVMWVNMIGHKL